MWKEKLEKIVKEKYVYGEKVNDGATEEEIQLFRERVTAELGIVLPEEYLEILKFVNGIEFNGCIFYGIDEPFLVSDPYQHINGFMDCNKMWYENEWQKEYGFLGESSISWFVYELASKRYFELDNPSGSKVREFDSLQSMLEKLLSDSLL